MTFWVNPFGVAWTMLGRNLNITTQDSCAFYNDSFGGVVLGLGDGLNIAGALEPKKAAILSNHRLMTCGRSVESCVFWFISLERWWQAQLLADAAAAMRGGETVKVSDNEALFTYDAIQYELTGWFSTKPAFDAMEHKSGNAYNM